MTAVAPELTVLDELDWQPACDLPQCEDDHPPATWHLIIDIGCPHPNDHLICDPCAARVRSDMSRDGVAVACSVCRRVGDGPDPWEYVSLTCLGGH